MRLSFTPASLEHDSDCFLRIGTTPLQSRQRSNSSNSVRFVWTVGSYQHLCKIPLCVGPLICRASHSNIMLSSTDRALRVLRVQPLNGLLEPIHRFQDLINRTAWNAIGFSGDGEYVMGGAGHKMAHNVFIWDRDSGVLVKVLEGPRESLVDCDVSGWSD